MIRAIQKKIETCLQELLHRQFQLEHYDIPDAAYPDQQNGDLSYTLAFPLAKALRKNPKAIAQTLMDAFPLDRIPEIERLELGGNGYLNFYLKRSAIAQLLRQTPEMPAESLPGKAIVEHTNINPNKAAHVGHLRNACLGDTLVRLLKHTGRQVEVQNYIDDTGVQLADVVLGFQRLGKGIEDLNSIPGRLDYYFWDLYAETHQWIEQSPENKALRDQTLKAMEERSEPVFSLSQAIADRIIRCHLDTMERLGIHYQLLPRESDIIGMKFWQHTFELLKSKNAVTMVHDGKNKGCWIMRLSEHEAFEEMENPDKIIVRSNGTVTYVGKDIAYQLWKFGLLGLNFHYRTFDHYPDGTVLWTTSTLTNAPEEPSFGGADTVYNVIDQRQSYLQKVVAQGLRALGYHNEAEKSIHFSYEVVTLAPKTAIELGFHLTDEEKGKAFVEMSGRKGLGVKADDLMDRLEHKTLERMGPLYKDLTAEQLKDLAADVASGALRYFMLRFTRNTVINFDMDEVLSLEGETGPYLQYSLVRARSIFQKLRAAGVDAAILSDAELQDALLLLDEKDQESNDSWGIIREACKANDVISKTLRGMELSSFAKYVFQFARLFNSYYREYPIIHESQLRRKMLRIAVVQMFISAMERNLDLMGIPVPARM